MQKLKIKIGRIIITKNQNFFKNDKFKVLLKNWPYRKKISKIINSQYF